MKYIALIFAVTFGVGCSALPKEYSKAPTRSLVRGESTPSSNVLIRKVDDGEMLWRGANNLGNDVWLEPGSHKVAVMCVTNTSWGSRMGGAEVVVKVQQGSEYLIKANPMKSSDKKPTASVIKLK